MSFNSRDGVAILQLIVYVVFLFFSILICLRHGFRRNSGWLFLAIFSTLRIIGASAQLATISAGTNATPYTIAAVCTSIGLSPLLLSTLGLLSRVYAAILSPEQNRSFTLTFLRVPQLLVTVALILGIVAATSGSPAQYSSDSSAHTDQVASIAIYLVAWVILAGLTVNALPQVRQRKAMGSLIDSSSWRIVLAVACSLPFILVRAIYSALSASGDSTFNLVTGSVTVWVVMAVLEEIAVVAIYVFTGFGLDPATAPTPADAVVSDPESRGPARYANTGGRGYPAKENMVREHRARRG